MARGKPRGFRCRINKSVKRQCARRGRKLALVRTIKANNRTLLRICRLKRGPKARARSRTRRRRVSGVYEVCRII